MAAAGGGGTVEARAVEDAVPLWFEEKEGEERWAMFTIEGALRTAGVDVDALVDRAVEQLRGHPESVALARAHIASFPGGGWAVPDAELPLALLLLVNWALRMAPRKLKAMWEAMGVPYTEATTPETARALIERAFDARRLVALTPLPNRPAAKLGREPAETQDGGMSWFSRFCKHARVLYLLMEEAGCDTLGRCGEAVGYVWEEYLSRWPADSSFRRFARVLRLRLCGKAAALPAERSLAYAAGALLSWPCSPMAFSQIAAYNTGESDYQDECSGIIETIRGGVDWVHPDAGISEAFTRGYEDAGEDGPGGAPAEGVSEEAVRAKKRSYFDPEQFSADAIPANWCQDAVITELGLVAELRAQRADPEFGSCDPLHPTLAPSLSLQGVELRPVRFTERLGVLYCEAGAPPAADADADEEDEAFKLACKAAHGPSVGELVARKLGKALRDRFRLPEAEAAAASPLAREGEAPVLPLEGGPVPLYATKAGPAPLPTDAARTLLRAAGVCGEDKAVSESVQAAFAATTTALLKPVAAAIAGSGGAAAAAAGGGAAAAAAAPAIITSGTVGAALRRAMPVYGLGVTRPPTVWTALRCRFSEAKRTYNHDLLKWDWRFTAALQDVITDAILRAVEAAPQPVTSKGILAAVGELLPNMDPIKADSADMREEALKGFPAEAVRGLVKRELGIELDDDAVAIAALLGDALLHDVTYAVQPRERTERWSVLRLAPFLARHLSWDFAVAHGGQAVRPSEPKSGFRCPLFTIAKADSHLAAGEGAIAAAKAEGDEDEEAEKVDKVGGEYRSVEERSWRGMATFAHPLNGFTYGTPNKGEDNFFGDEGPRAMERDAEADARDTRSAAARREDVLKTMPPGDRLVVDVDEKMEEAAALLRLLEARSAQALPAPLVPAHIFADAAYHALAGAGAAGPFELTLEALQAMQYAVEATLIASLRAAAEKLGGSPPKEEEGEGADDEAGEGEGKTKRVRLVLRAADVADLLAADATAAGGRSLPARRREDDEDDDEGEGEEADADAAPAAKRARDEL